MRVLSEPDGRGRFGAFGGRFVPEVLMGPLAELDEAFREARGDPGFRAELGRLLREYAGRPTPLWRASRLSRRVGGAEIYLKREDLAHTGSHKINNTIGQCLLARRMGKGRVIAETGAGQHGVATATAAALLGLECRVYMGEEDVRRQRLNVVRMRLLGAEVVPVASGSATLKDAINEAFRDWVTNCPTTHYVLGSVVGPHPYPWMVREFQKVIGEEARVQCLEAFGDLPGAVVACVGGGSNAIGAFWGFLGEPGVRLVGVEAAGEGLETGRHGASLARGEPGTLHGSLSLVLQDPDGQIHPTHSVSAGLDYPGVGPEHAYLREEGLAEYTTATDDEAVAAFLLLSETEGILPALEPAHALAVAVRLAREMGSGGRVLVNLSGRGDKDVDVVASYLERRPVRPEEVLGV